MNINEIYKNYLDTLNKRVELEKRIEGLIEKWKNGDTTISNTTLQQTIDKGYERLEELRRIEKSLHMQYLAQVEREKAKRLADISVQHYLGETPTNIEIIDGVLSSNASESHLIGKQKTPEQLESEKAALLSDVKSKAMNHEISLSEASKLANDVNTAYDFYDNSSEELANNSEMHR